MKLLITEPSDFSSIAFDILKSHFEVVRLSKKEDLSKHIHNVEIVFIRLGVFFSKELLKKAYNLKIICTPTTGLDHIDEDFCFQNNIKIISLKGEIDFLGTIPSTAEHTFTLLNAVNRYLHLATQSVINKQWERNQFKAFNLSGKTLGILGLGRVGKQVANFANAFGMNVFAYDIAIPKKHSKVKILDSPHDLFRSSDFITIHIPLVEENINYVNKELIMLMKPNACIINTSRGKVLDEEAVVDALLNHKIRGVATDVVYNEMENDLFSSPIFKVDARKYNCIITPHIAGATYDSMQMTEDFIARSLINYV